MRKHLSTIILVGIFFIGLSVLLYPTISNYWNSRLQLKVVTDYDDKVNSLSDEESYNLLKTAQDYNEQLRQLRDSFSEYEKIGDYNNVLNVNGYGTMGYLDIEKIKVELPIYHGVSREILSDSVGHLPGTSLPIGGPSTHAVLTSHRGLPSAKLFTDLDKLELGDVFTITVLKQKITYEVDDIRIVEPNEMQTLRIEEGQDLCTLVTCTPYGINTHRLLVRGHRIANLSDFPNLVVPNDAIRIDPLVVAPIVAVPLLLLLFVMMMVKYRRKK